MEAAVEAVGAAPALAAMGRPQRVPTANKGKKKRQLDTDDSSLCKPSAPDATAAGHSEMALPPQEGASAGAEAPAQAAAAPKPRRQRRPKQAHGDDDDYAPRKRARSSCQPRSRAPGGGARARKAAEAAAEAAAAEQAAQQQASGTDSFAIVLSSTSSEEEAAGAAAVPALAKLGVQAQAAAAAAEGAQAKLRVIEPPAAGIALPAVRSVVHAPEATWPLQGYSGTPQMASMQEMLEWLGRTARAGGCSVPFCTGPFDTAPPAWQPAAIERRYRACLGRARGATFERVDAAAAEELVGSTRRSSRVRQPVEVFVPFDEPGFGRSERERRESTAMLEGPEYQAELPKVRPKPKQTPAGEARWLTGRVQPAGAWGPVSSRIPVHASLDASSGTVTWSVRGSKPLSAASVTGLGLTLMGPGVRQSWLDTSIDAFEAAISEHGKDFELICGELGLIPGKGVADAVDLFYNVWKTRGLARAAAWYARRVQEKERLRLLAEMEPRQRPSAGDRAARDGRSAEQIAADRKASQVRAEHRRQIKDALVYIRECIRRPMHSSYTKTRMLERLRRGRQVLDRAPAGTDMRAALMEGL